MFVVLYWSKYHSYSLWHEKLMAKLLHECQSKYRTNLRFQHNEYDTFYSSFMYPLFRVTKCQNISISCFVPFILCCSQRLHKTSAFKDTINVKQHQRSQVHANVTVIRELYVKVDIFSCTKVLEQPWGLSLKSFF